MNTIYISTRMLRAASRFMADKHDPRKQLHGVHIEATPRLTRFTATNGHAIFFGRFDPVAAARMPNEGAPFAATIHADIVRGLCAWKLPQRGYLGDIITMRATPEGARFEWCGNGFAAIPAPFVDAAPFPAGRKLIPETFRPGMAAYDPALLVKLEQAARDLRGSKARDTTPMYSWAAADDPKTGLAVFSDVAFALVMPRRCPAPDVADIQWAREEMTA